MRRFSRVLLSALSALCAAALLASPATATFSGPTGRISFARAVPATNGIEIFTAKPDGSAVTQLTVSGQDRNSIFTDWSPDGQRIAFDSDRTGTNEVQIWLMDWNGANQTQLTTGPGFHGDPAWSPDGKRLALESDWNDYPALQGIWTIPADAGPVGQADATRVTTLPAGFDFDSEPQYSPDGSQIVFTRFRRCKVRGHGHLAGFPHGCLSATFVVRTDGTGLRQLTPWGLNTSAPDWAPDGRKITFDRCDSAKVGCKGDIWTMNPDGSGRRRLTNFPPATNVSHNFDNFRFDFANNPVFAPSGAKILFTHWVPFGGTELLTMAPDGTGQTALIGESEFQNWADWGTNTNP